MGQPVKLSDQLVLDARLAGERMARSINGQIELWARLGRALEPILRGEAAMRLAERGRAVSLAERLSSVDSPAGEQRLREHLSSLPFPHYEPHPQERGLLVRIDADGTRTVGRFINRVFERIDDSQQR